MLLLLPAYAATIIAATHAGLSRDKPARDGRRGIQGRTALIAEKRDDPACGVACRKVGGTRIM